MIHQCLGTDDGDLLCEDFGASEAECTVYLSFAKMISGLMVDVVTDASGGVTAVTVNSCGSGYTHCFFNNEINSDP